MNRSLKKQKAETDKSATKHTEKKKSPEKELQSIAAAEISEDCNVKKRCGGCSLIGIPYERQLETKQRNLKKLLGNFAPVEPIIGMKDPYHYRNKVHHVFAYDRKKGILSGCYEENSHRVVDITDCLIEDEICQDVIRTVRDLCISFKIRTYDEDTGFGSLRHVLVRRGFQSGEIMVVLVLGDPILPGKNNFVKALLKAHPDITTIVLNINNKKTSMVLGEREIVLYGPGFIRDTLCGLSFRISPKSFYQVNPVQTEVLYDTALRFAGLTGKESVIDAYCGIGTIGLSVAHLARTVLGIELNPDAVRDAKLNARENKITNARFVVGDAGELMEQMAERGEQCDCVFMDPPRSGSSEKFLGACIKLSPERIVYVSCGPDTLARDLKYLILQGYQVEIIQPVDMFPFTEHVECVVSLSRK